MKPPIRILLSSLLVAVLATSAAPAGVVFQVEVAAVDARSWTVHLRGLESGKTMLMELKPESFVGQTFNAIPAAPAAGRQFAAQGPSGQPVVRGRLIEDAEEQPGRKPERRRPERFEGRYRVLEADSQASTLTVLDQKTDQVWKVEVDPEAFVGYRFGLDAEAFVRGAGAVVVTPQRNVIERCCTWIEP